MDQFDEVLVQAVGWNQKEYGMYNKDFDYFFAILL